MVTCFITIIYVMFGHFLLVPTRQGLDFTDFTSLWSPVSSLLFMSCLVTFYLYQLGYLVKERKKDSLLHFTPQGLDLTYITSIWFHVSSLSLLFKSCVVTFYLYQL